MITANEAREISGTGLDEHLSFIENEIRAAAKDKKHEVIIRDNPYAHWLYGSDRPEVAKSVIKELENSGFKVSLYYAEYQFVDMGLWIKWGKS